MCVKKLQKVTKHMRGKYLVWKSTGCGSGFWILSPLFLLHYRIEHVRNGVPYFNFSRTEELNRNEEIRRGLLTVSLEVEVHLNKNLL
jgi:hypothetical protein